MGGKFRLIDFTLSNGSKRRDRQRGIICHPNPAPYWTISGREGMGTARKRDGLFYLPADVEDIIHPVEGDIHSFYKNLLFVKRGHSPYILATSCDLVQNIDYEEVLHFHRRHNTDVTMRKSITQAPGQGKEDTSGNQRQRTGSRA